MEYMRERMTNVQYKDKNKNKKIQKLRKIRGQKNSDIKVESSKDMKS